MEAYSFHAPFSDHIDISSSDASLREQALVEILQAAEAAAMSQVRYFVIYRGPEHWDFNEEKQRLDRLKWAAEILKWGCGTLQGARHRLHSRKQVATSFVCSDERYSLDFEHYGLGRRGCLPRYRPR